MENPAKNIDELFRTIVEPVIQDIADEYNALEAYRAVIGNEHPRESRSRAITGQRGLSPSRTILRAISIKVYDQNIIVTVSVFYPQGSQSISVMKLGVIGSEQIKLEEITKEILERKIRQYLPKAL